MTPQIIYSSKKKTKKGSYKGSGSNSTEQYIKHFENMCVLSMVSANRETPFMLRRQAEYELVEARRLMKFFETRPDFSISSVSNNTFAAKQRARVAYRNLVTIH